LRIISHRHVIVIGVEQPGDIAVFQTWPVAFLVIVGAIEEQAYIYLCFALMEVDIVAWMNPANKIDGRAQRRRDLYQ
jgi:hypothetical protein